METGQNMPLPGQVLIILRQQDEPVTVAGLGSLLNAWGQQDHLMRVLADLAAARLVAERRGGWVAV